MNYVGRFAPSPTGPLHMGSLVAALASWLEARTRNGKWLMRMENLDPPREQPGAQQSILNTLEAHGLTWDGDVVYQSDRSDLYDQVIEQLLKNEEAFHCLCSRKELALSAGLHTKSCPTSYDPKAKLPAAIRVRVSDQEVCFNDPIQGQFCQQLKQNVGDFVIKRKDGLYAYQIAVVVDDELQGINHIVRGSDLLDSTPRQIYLQDLLGYRKQAYIHLPVLVNEQGQKLSKQTFAKAIKSNRAQRNLVEALRYLKQPCPNDLDQEPIESILNWAIENWTLSNLPNQLQVSA